MLLAIAFGSLKLDPADAIPATIAYAQTRKTNPDMIDVLKKKLNCRERYRYLSNGQHVFFSVAACTAVWCIKGFGEATHAYIHSLTNNTYFTQLYPLHPLKALEL